MALRSKPRRITPSSPEAAGLKQGTWRWEAVYTARKTCPVCRQLFKPRAYVDRHGVLIVQSRPVWAKQITCGNSCSKKLKNPMSNPETRSKVRATHKRTGHRPRIRGGNGRPMPPAQARLWQWLGEGWETEYVVKTGMRYDQGYPHHFKIDIAHPGLMVAIEVDGTSHSTRLRQQADDRKQRLLERLGWRVYRVSNSTALSVSSTFPSPDTRLTLLAEYASTTATRSGARSWSKSSCRTSSP